MDTPGFCRKASSWHQITAPVLCFQRLRCLTDRMPPCQLPVPEHLSADGSLTWPMNKIFLPCAWSPSVFFVSASPGLEFSGRPEQMLLKALGSNVCNTSDTPAPRNTEASTQIWSEPRSSSSENNRHACSASSNTQALL